MNANGTRTPARRFGPHGFALTELLIVAGLISVLASLLLPVVGRLRASSNAAACLANLHQMETAWTMYTVDNHGRLLDYNWYTPDTPDVAWGGYWPGTLERYGVQGTSTMCPAAASPMPFNFNKGYGTATKGWTGKFSSNGSVIRLTATKYRDGGYGYNRYLTAGGGFGRDGKADYLAAVRNLWEVPVFLDCAFVDVRPTNGTELAQPPAPPNLRGDAITLGTPDHWKFLLARHGRGINVVMADGSARWMSPEDTYTLTWKTGWAKYRLANLPAN
jgi:prepilin-type N-terminal cleavage/methylation domain-containing protein/prepilin-type processing-associated H-X9-DG protein